MDVTAPVEEPVSLELAKLHCRIDHNDDDVLIAGYIRSARQLCEQKTGRLFIRRRLRATLAGFPARREPILLNLAPVLGIAEISYLAPGGSTTVFPVDSYVALTDLVPGRIAMTGGREWPETLDQANAVSIIFDAGYDGSGTTPELETARQAILLLVGSWYGQRESAVIGVSATELPDGVAALLAGLRVFWF